MKLELQGVRKTFGAHHALTGADLDVEFAHCLVLIGPSGGGKSTLLRCLAGLETPETGRIALDGEVLPMDPKGLRAYRQRVGMVFQSFNLFPHLSALENVLLPLTQVHGLRRKEAEERAREVFARFQLEAHAGKHPAALSGGQRQRVAIARAVAVRPTLMLLDEPTSALDPEMTAEVLDLIDELRESGRPIILVTHEMGFARHSAEAVAFVADGRVLESGPAEAFFHQPKTEAAQRFLNRILRY